MAGPMTQAGRRSRDGNFYGGAISNADVDSIEDIAEIDVSLMQTLWVQFTVATNPLTAFEVQFRVNSAGTYVGIASASTDYTSPAGPILGTSGDLTIAGTSGTHWLKLDVSAVATVKLRAAGANSVLAGYYGGN